MNIGRGSRSNWRMEHRFYRFVIGGFRFPADGPTVRMCKPEIDIIAQPFIHNFIEVILS